MSELHDHAAEAAFLGAVWHSAGRVLDDTDVTAEDFHHPSHERLWTALQHLHASGAPWDEAGIVQALGADVSRIQDAMLGMVTSTTVPQSAGWHANTLKAWTLRRRAVVAATRIHQAATSDTDPDNLAEFARTQVETLETGGDDQTPPTWAEQLTNSLNRWQTPVTDAIATGWHDLDEMLSGGGLRPGHLTVVGARPGIGKSLVATMLAGRTAAAGHGVYFASVEMSVDELTDRIAAASTGINLADLTNRTLSEDQLLELQTGVKRISPWPLYIDDRVTAVAHIRRGARRVARSRSSGLGLVLIDYLQIMDGKAAAGASREQVVSGMSRSLKLLSKELNVPVVLLSQLNRGSVQRADKQPLISDLRESGAVEQDADEVILLHRDDEDPDLAGQIQLNLAKNRHGRTGVVRLRWQPYISRIVNPGNSWGAA